MSAIFISLDSVRRLNEELRRCSLQLGTLSNGVQQAKCGLDPRIQARRNIHQRASDSCRRLVELEERLSRLISFNEFAVHSYGSIENRLVKEAERLFSGARGGLDHLYQYYSRILDNGQLVALRGLALNSLERYLAVKSYLAFSDNIKFKVFEKGGIVYFQLKNSSIQSGKDFRRYYDLLRQSFGGSGKWNRTFVTELVNEGVPIYDQHESRYFKKNKNKLYNIPFDNLKDALNDLHLGSHERTSKFIKSEVSAAIKVWDDFSGWKGAATITKLTKATGILGTTVMTFDNIFTSYYDAESSQWDFKNGQNNQEFAVGMAVDIGVTAAAIATGATVGSFFVPPIGTAVGAVTFGAVSFALDYPIIGDPPKSLVDFSKDKINDAIDYVQEINWSDVGDNLSNKVSNFTDNINDKVSDLLDDTGEFVSGIGKNISKLIW